MAALKHKLVLIVLVLSILRDAAAGEKEINPAPWLTIDGLGNGYSTPAISSDMIFVTGEQEGTGMLFAYDFTGTLLWKKTYGREWTISFRGSRASPILIDSLVYTISGMGDISCFLMKTGETKWGINMIGDLHGVNAVYGYSMPALIEKERLYCQPGGPDTNIACLNRLTGKIIWTSAANGESPGYSPPVFIRHNNTNLLVTFSEMAILGLDADSGDLLWTYELSFKGNLPCNKIIYSGGFLYVVAGHGNGGFKFEISDDDSRITKIWHNIKFDTYFGDFVLTGNFLYGSSDSQRLWWSINTETGNVSDSLDFRTGTTVSAGEELVLYNQAGKVGLVRPDQGKMILEKSFKITAGTNEHFSHPLVAGGFLFIRHGCLAGL